MWTFGLIMCAQLLFVNTFHLAILVQYWVSFEYCLSIQITDMAHVFITFSLRHCFFPFVTVIQRVHKRLLDLDKCQRSPSNDRAICDDTTTILACRVLISIGVQIQFRSACYLQYYAFYHGFSLRWLLTL